MSYSPLWAGALGLLLIHQETGCPHSAAHAARLLDALSETDGVDAELGQLCARAAERLANRAATPGQ